MKRKVAVILLSMCMGIAGCAANGTSDGNDTKTVESMEEESAGSDMADGAAGSGEALQQEKQTEQGDAVQNVQEEDGMLYQDVVLTREAPADKVSIAVHPSVLSTYSIYYYTPEGGAQEWLRQFLDTLPSEGAAGTGLQKGLKETGWQVVYEDKYFMAFEGGYLQYSFTDEKGELVECFAEAPKLCDYIQIMLQEKLGYASFDPADIKDIVSARMEVCSLFTDYELYSQTVTDEETLKLLEDWFSNAEYIYGGADCGNQCACLELTLADGETVFLSMAVDSCPNFGINGVYYDYRPVSDWEKQEFFKLFDEIPWE